MEKQTRTETRTDDQTVMVLDENQEKPVLVMHWGTIIEDADAEERAAEEADAIARRMFEELN